MPRLLSKNTPTIEQIEIACRNVNELMKSGMSENLAIRNLELFADLYAKSRILGVLNNNHISQCKLWSVAARKAKTANPNKAYGQYLRYEHGTPRRTFARHVLDGFNENKLSKRWMDKLCEKLWKVAAITLEEDKRLALLTRRTFKSPDERWRAAEIKFERSKLG